MKTSAVSASAASALPETYYPQESGATNLHKGGLTGRGVTVAVLDSGLWRERGPLQKTSYGKDQRVLAQYDAIQARANPTNYDDAFGHGTHISSIIANAAVASTGRLPGRRARRESRVGEGARQPTAPAATST